MNFDHKILKNKTYRSIYSLENDKNVEEYGASTFSLQLDDLDSTNKIPIFPDLDFIVDPQLSVAKNIQKNEIRNCKILYDAIKDDMNWIKALNKNLWTCLCHTKYFDYTKKRHARGNIEEINNRFKSFSSADDKEKSQLKNIIKNRFCTKDDSSRSLTTNHISRLWMVAEMTYMCWERFDGLEELKKQNPYHYTEMALKQQDLFFDMYQRPSVMSNRSFGIAILEYLHKDWKNGKKGMMKRYTRNFSRPFLKSVFCNIVVAPIDLNFNLQETFSYFDDIAKDLNLI